MSAIVWDKIDERMVDQGVDHGVLYDGVASTYVDGVPWNGLVTVTKSPSGAEPNKQYADNIVYVNLLSAEEFSATVECFMAPKKFDQYNGIYTTANGLQISGQNRSVFGFSWRTLRGSAEDPEAGYVIHMAYGLQSSPSEEAASTKNDTPEPKTFSFSFSSTPIAVTGHKPTSYVAVDSNDPTVDPENLAALELILYGTTGVEPRLPLPDEVDSILGTGVADTLPVAPAYDAGTDTITIPTTTGVDYRVDGEIVAAGALVITEDTVVTATPKANYNFGPPPFVTAWLYEVS